MSGDTRTRQGSRSMRPRRRTTDIEFVEIDGELVIFDERNDSLHHLNPTAALLWQVCDGTATVAELAAELADAFGLSIEDADRDLRAAIKEFRDAGLMDVPKRRNATSA